MEGKGSLYQKVTISNGPDFSVYQITINEKDTFNLYSGWYATFPSEIKLLANKRKREQYGFESNFPKGRKHIINNALKNGVFKGKLKSDNTYNYELDSLIPPKFDSLLLTIFSDSIKNIWILEPPKNELGKIDIVIEYEEIDKRTYHLFSYNSNQEQRNSMIKIAKSIK